MFIKEKLFEIVFIYSLYDVYFMLSNKNLWRNKFMLFFIYLFVFVFIYLFVFVLNRVSVFRLRIVCLGMSMCFVFECVFKI